MHKVVEATPPASTHVDGKEALHQFDAVDTTSIKPSVGVGLWMRI